VRTVYLGTSAFAAEVLRSLAHSPHRPGLVVSRPDSPQGRGRKLTAPPTVTVARELGIEVFQPETVNNEETRNRVAAAEPEALCVCAFGALIKEPLLSDRLILNVHPSLLPRWRGAAPIERAILAGDTETGVSIMQLTAGLDSGPICLQERIAIEPDDDYGALAAKLERLSGRMIVRAFDDLAAGTLDFTEQDEAHVSYAEKLTAEDRRLDPSRPAAELALRVRALSPHIGAYLQQPDGTRLGVWQARVTDEGELELVTVQPPGKRPMSYEAYLRGLKR
jgi:methionyl-tRNA formyltransferase